MTDPVVRRRVRSAFHALTLARGVECALIGGGTLLGTLAVLVCERNSLGSLDAWSVALACGAFAGATWWLEHSPEPAGVARRLDRRLGMDGMLFTAWESEREEGALGGLLSGRVAARVPKRRALEAVLPTSAPLLVLPFLGAGMLAFALDVRVSEEDPTERLRELTRGARGHIAQAGHEGELSPELAAELEALAAASDLLLEDLETSPSSTTAAAYEELLSEVERLREEVPAGEEASRALDQAEELFEAARLALGEEALVVDGEGSGQGSSAEEGGQGGRGGAQGGTMSGIDPRAETAPDGLAQETWEGPEGALGPGTHWPEEHRGVVRRWVEKVRNQETESDD